MENDDVDVIQGAWLNYRSRLLAFIQSRVGSEADAEDILSLAFVKLIRQERAERLPTKVVPWLYRVVRNSITDYYRTAKNYDELPSDVVQDEPDPTAFEVLSGCMDPMIGLLREPYRSVLRMSDINGMKNREIADALGRSVSAIKSQVLRARKLLRDKVSACCQLQRGAQGTVADFEQKSYQCCRRCGD